VAEEEHKSFWSSAPKVIGAAAGLITAIGGLLVALHQVGVIGGKPEENGLEGSGAAAAEGLPAPVPIKPECGTTIRLPPDNYFFILGWRPVEGASNYTVEADCFGCREFGRKWHSQEAGSPWHIRRGLGLRAPTGANPIYSSKLHLDLLEQQGLALRWRVWAVDHDGREGQKSEWCQISYTR
jgi:hypothetical protein